MSSESKEYTFTIMALESGIKYPDLDSVPDEPLLIEMVGIQPEFFGPLSTKFEVDLEDLQDLLDMDERPRIQIEDKFTMIVLRVPVDLNDPTREYSTAPIGIFTNGRDIIIMQHQPVPLKKKRLRHLIRRSTTASEIIYNQWEIVIHSFETVLDIIEATIKNTEQTIQKDLYPSRMDQFFQLSRDAIFVDAALKGNIRVLRGMKRFQRFGKMILDEDRLEELEVDLQQQIELSKIYRELIENAMEIYDSIVGHNLNTVMKTLTAVSLLVSVPTLIASIYGMNVGLPLEQEPVAFLIVLLASFILTIPFYVFLRMRSLI
ncbi:MAG: magnesium transporter CorA family protein [Candidatus Thorarchaeota archaeon]|nr:magnesium transporter CorA family protein [Candidatus Thorarchaeota archaeon]